MRSSIIGYRLRATIPEVTPGQAYELQRRGAVLVDVREPDEAEGRDGDDLIDGRGSRRTGCTGD